MTAHRWCGTVRDQLLGRMLPDGGPAGPLARVVRAVEGDGSADTRPFRSSWRQGRARQAALPRPSSTPTPCARLTSC